MTAVIVAIGSGRDLMNDEYATAYLNRLSWRDFGRFIHNWNDVEAVYELLMRLWTDVFGDSAYALRAPSIIAMAITAGAVTVFGMWIYSKLLGVVAGLIFAVLPSVSVYGHEATPYAWIAAVGTLSTLALLYALAAPSVPGRWVLYGGSILALTLLYAPAGMVVAAHALIAYLARRRVRAALTAWLVTASIAAIVLAPFLHLVASTSFDMSWVTSTWRDVQYYPIGLFDSELISWGVAGLAVVGAARLAQSRPGVAAPLVALALIPPVLAYLSNSHAHAFQSAGDLLVVPAWLLLAAAAFAVTPGRPAHGVPLSALVAALVTMAVLSLAGMGSQRAARQSPVGGRTGLPLRSGRGGRRLPTRRRDRLRRYRSQRADAVQLRIASRRSPIDVYAAVSSAANGSLDVVPCADPVACLGTTRAGLAGDQQRQRGQLRRAVTRASHTTPAELHRDDHRGPYQCPGRVAGP